MPCQPIQVTCYSGHSYAQEPRAFTWQGKCRTVVAVERTWRTPSGPHFHVLTESGARFDLDYNEQNDEWLLEVVSNIYMK